MRTTRGWTPLAAGITLALALAEPIGAAKIVCWTNSDGVRECGNAVPPEYAQQSTERKSSHGITVERTQRAKTKEELELERAERERLAAEDAERRQREAEQAKRDRVLLQTFTTEEDLKLTRDGKVAAIDSRIKHSRQLARKLEGTLSELREHAATLERGGQKVPADLQQNIAEVQAQVDGTIAQIGRREQERIELGQKFESDLARYRELKGTRIQ